MPILDTHTLEFVSRSPEQTRRLGARLGALLNRSDVICLSGDLGAGKTTFVQGVAQGWGSLDAVSSPTFVLVNTYRRADGQRLYHLDAYRLSGALEAEDLDLDALMDTGAMLVEWPERIDPVLPRERLWVSLRHMVTETSRGGDEQRGMVISSQGKRYDDILADFRKRVFGG